MPLSDAFSNVPPQIRIAQDLTGLAVLGVAELALVGQSMTNPNSGASWAGDIDGIGGDTVSAVLLCNQADPDENGIWDPTVPEQIVANGDASPGDVIRVTGDGDIYNGNLFVRQADGSWKNEGATGQLDGASPATKTPATNDSFDNTAPGTKTP